jgi:hypothetical protein
MTVESQLSPPAPAFVSRAFHTCTSCLQSGGLNRGFCPEGLATVRNRTTPCWNQSSGLLHSISSLGSTYHQMLSSDTLASVVSGSQPGQGQMFAACAHRVHLRMGPEALGAAIHRGDSDQAPESPGEADHAGAPHFISTFPEKVATFQLPNSVFASVPSSYIYIYISTCLEEIATFQLPRDTDLCVCFRIQQICGAEPRA